MRTHVWNFYLYSCINVCDYRTCFTVHVSIDFRLKQQVLEKVFATHTCSQFFAAHIFIDFRVWATSIEERICEVFDQMPHFMHFSIAARESYTLLCVLFDDNFLFLCLFGLFTPWCECICGRFDCRPCCHSRAVIFYWNFDDFV